MMPIVDPLRQVIKRVHLFVGSDVGVHAAYPVSFLKPRGGSDALERSKQTAI